jgi:hypothetical protein
VLCGVFISMFLVMFIMGVYSCPNAMSNITVLVTIIFCNFLFFY